MVRSDITTVGAAFEMLLEEIEGVIEDVNNAGAAFAPIVERAARMTCTTPEFDNLASEFGLGSHKNGATNPAERSRLRAERDGLVAHLYGLTESEFGHILSTFPLVPSEIREAALRAYGEVEKGRVQ